MMLRGDFIRICLRDTLHERRATALRWCSSAWSERAAHTRYVSGSNPLTTILLRPSTSKMMVGLRSNR